MTHFAALVCLLAVADALTLNPGGQSQVARSNAPAGTNAKDFVALQKTVATSDYFHEQVRFLCNSIGPRLSGSPQAAAAVEYVSAQMRGLGLNVKLEPV